MNRKVLVCIDDPVAVQTAINLLTEHGFDAIVAADGKEALTKIPQERPWLMIVGDTLGDMTGFQMVSLLPREQRPVLFVIRNWSTVHDGDLGWGDLPVQIYQDKPIHPVYFVRYVNTLFAEANQGSTT